MLVILLQNLDIKAGLVNGTMGEIVGREKYDFDKPPKCSQKVRKQKERDPTVATVIGDYDWMMERNIKRFVYAAEIKEWSTVKFGRVGETRMIYADCTVNEVGDEKPYSLLSRTQIPLMAGWAMTIHKSQGMTSVALSRPRSLKDLYVEALGRELGCNEQVKRFLLATKLISPKWLEGNSS